MYIPVGKYLLRYFVFVGLPYLVAKQIERYLVNRLNPEIKKELNDKLKKFPDIENISEETRDGLNTRGGSDPIMLWLTKVIVVDFALKVAIAGLFGSTIFSDTADNAAGNLAKYLGPIISAPGNKFKRLANRLRGIDPHAKYGKDIREILIDRDLTLSDKVELLKIKIQQAFKEFKGARKKRFILFAIATILFTVGGNGSAFAFVMDHLREFLGRPDEDDSLKNALIEVYKEYNAPLPFELLPESIKESIKNIK